MGWDEESIESMEETMDENDLQRLADNSSNINMLKAILEKIQEL